MILEYLLHWYGKYVTPIAGDVLGLCRVLEVDQVVRTLELDQTIREIDCCE